ncbi:phenylacetic acid degradation operon negative regulatory protein PaaX [Pseudomaricurvus alkylphenolicus]|uniref:phenylacetic acid degradation operon negative regulatory protein PaaX n=1 Tax=Pseudomaricurvus alkylphenolicus TaxID=1306991 RepID=UPI00141E189F|nr:phenylacetic acid degradation operon negative regulatory protein PaaX [Pseudomaricurvus alkylphenolicus]NIB40909.1 phenylacetic acid degradation operon negative regulatory protein PaaX [Pseudomaricurvus alkylphenolicus]
MARLKSIDNLLTEFQQQRPIRGGSLIVSVFGDSISQHGGSVWLGSLIDALEPFGLNQRLVRTSVYRLIQENWLASNQIGRRSYYSFTDHGLRQYQKTARRIYASSRSEWDGQWTLVIPAYVEDERDELRKELRWLGYGALATGILARPGADRRSLDETLQELGVVDKVVVMNAHTEEVASQKVLRELSQSCWNLNELEERYNAFLERYRPVLKAVSKSKQLEPDQCFQLRTLLIHDYRRILLKDTDLPDALLPSDWAGRAALNLTANIYKSTYRGAEQFLLEHMETADGRLPSADASFYQRFGGLE